MTEIKIAYGNVRLLICRCQNGKTNAENLSVVKRQRIVADQTLCEVQITGFIKGVLGFSFQEALKFEIRIFRPCEKTNSDPVM